MVIIHEAINRVKHVKNIEVIVHKAITRVHSVLQITALSTWQLSGYCPTSTCSFLNGD
jgi:hypothetical protein